MGQLAVTSSQLPPPTTILVILEVMLQWGAWLAQPEEHETLNLKAVSLEVQAPR